LTACIVLKQIRKGGNLVITKTRKSDAGTYACVASNGAGRRISNEAMLRVDGRWFYAAYKGSFMHA